MSIELLHNKRESVISPQDNQEAENEKESVPIQEISDTTNRAVQSIGEQDSRAKVLINSLSAETPEQTQEKLGLLEKLKRAKISALNNLRLAAFAGVLAISAPASAEGDTGTESLIQDNLSGEISPGGGGPSLQNAFENTKIIARTAGETAKMIAGNQIRGVVDTTKEFATGKDAFGGEGSRIDAGLSLVQNIPGTGTIGDVAGLIAEIKSSAENKEDAASVKAIRVAQILACTQVGLVPCFALEFLSDKWTEKITEGVNRELDKKTDVNVADILDGLYLSSAEDGADSMHGSDDERWLAVSDESAVELLGVNDGEKVVAAVSAGEEAVRLRAYLADLGGILKEAPMAQETVSEYLRRITRVATKEVGEFKQMQEAKAMM